MKRLVLFAAVFSAWLAVPTAADAARVAVGLERGADARRVAAAIERRTGTDRRA